MTPRGEKYIGTMNKDENGYECERWESNNQDSLSDQENYCRNPDGDKSPWCYTTDPNQQWAYCKIPAC
ncbi:hypothetical protein FSP39_007142 [Pinctada imbricata]|uniref:Kringle domain-containing protein n=1 Tax=Pinctada imbricata TaxID=66713 RepID=A0AA88XLI3_PINIB|nr:hypothetical protein FSP39_007142 [Pinctada imbricata]